MLLVMFLQQFECFILQIDWTRYWQISSWVRSSREQNCKLSCSGYM